MRRVDYMIGPKEFASLTAEQFMQDAVWHYTVSNTGEMLAQTLIDGGFGSVPIVAKDGTVVGIVSEFDLLNAVLEGRDLAEVTAEEMMTKDCVVVHLETPAIEILQLLQQHYLIRVPVVDTEGRLVGVVARRDLLLGYLRATEGIWTF